MKTSLVDIREDNELRSIAKHAKVHKMLLDVDVV